MVTTEDIRAIPLICKRSSAQPSYRAPEWEQRESGAAYVLLANTIQLFIDAPDTHRKRVYWEICNVSGLFLSGGYAETTQAAMTACVKDACGILNYCIVCVDALNAPPDAEHLDLIWNKDNGDI
jgi:hypothetical protein